MSEFQAMVSREMVAEILVERLIGQINTVTIPDFDYKPNPDMPLVIASTTEDEVIAMIVETQATPTRDQGLTGLGHTVLHLEACTVASSMADIASVTIYGEK